MSYRDDLTALAARHDALSQEVAAKTRELEASRLLLDQAHARAKLPVLDNLRIAAPCTADWKQMTGDERVRHCGDCKKNVYNLSGMTRDEAEALLIERNGDLCVRYYQRHDGTILLADCTIGVKRRRRHRWLAAGAAGLLGIGVGGALASRHKPTCVTMGAVALPPQAVDNVVPSYELPPPPVEGVHVQGGLGPEPSPAPVMGMPLPPPPRVKMGTPPAPVTTIKMGKPAR